MSGKGTLIECSHCQSAWPPDHYRLSDGTTSTVCKECGKASILERKSNPVAARQPTATVRELRKSKGKARIRGGTRIYRSG